MADDLKKIYSSETGIELLGDLIVLEDEPFVEALGPFIIMSLVVQSISNNSVITFTGPRIA